jgi:hypothetical protein|nr:MAG TPA: protein of unknown function (DUF4352) [Caudoviricetes sp.]
MKKNKHSILILLTIAFGIGLVTMSGLLFSALNEKSKLEKKYESLKEDKEQIENIKTRFVNYVYTVDSNLASEAMDFTLSEGEYRYQFGEPVLFNQTEITVGEPKKDTSGLLAMEHDKNEYKAVTVTLTINNKDISNVELNPRKFFASDEDGEYLEFDSVFSNDNTVAINSDSSVVFQAGKEGHVTIIFAMKQSNASKDVTKVEFGKNNWTK